MEVVGREGGKGGAGVRMTQHAFGGEDDERLAPRAKGLTTEQMKVLGGG